MKLASAFPCAGCGATLSARIVGAWIASIVLWSLLDIPLLTILADSPVSFIVCSLVSFGIGCCIFSVLLDALGSVSMVSDASGSIHDKK